METKRICLWSGPRNVSTAFMYSFFQRNDTWAIDEPLYGYYLQSTGRDHPGRETVLETQEKDGQKVLDQLSTKEFGYPVLFIKNMAHHLLDLPPEISLNFTNVFLIRDPVRVIASYIKKIPDPTLADIGLEKQLELVNFLENEGRGPLVVETSDLLQDPPLMLRTLCELIGIPWDQTMLKWDAGPKEIDGTWAKYWYHNAHRSTGFIESESAETELPEKYHMLAEEAGRIYQQLYDRRIKP